MEIHKYLLYSLLFTFTAEVVLTQLSLPTLSDLFTSLGDVTTQYGRRFGQWTYQFFRYISDLFDFYRFYQIMIEPIIKLCYKFLRFFLGPIYQFIIGFIKEYPNLFTGLWVTVFSLIVIYLVLLIAEIYGLNFKTNYKPRTLFKYLKDKVVSPFFLGLGTFFGYLFALPYEILVFFHLMIVITAIQELSLSFISLFSSIPTFFKKGFKSFLEREYYKKHRRTITASLYVTIITLIYISLFYFFGYDEMVKGGRTLAYGAICGMILLLVLFVS